MRGVLTLKLRPKPQHKSRIKILKERTNMTKLIILFLIHPIPDQKKTLNKTKL